MHGEESGPQGEIRSAWDALADFWDKRVESGRTWQGHLIQPAVERLLGLELGERVLDIACGNGAFARRMAELGGEVLAVDFSETMVERRVPMEGRSSTVRSMRPAKMLSALTRRTRVVRCHRLQHGHHGYGDDRTDDLVCVTPAKAGRSVRIFDA